MKPTAMMAIAVLLAAAGCELPPNRVAGSAGRGIGPDAPASGGPIDAPASRDGGLIPVRDAFHCDNYTPTTTPLSTYWINQQVASGHCSDNPPAVTVTNGVPSASTFYALCTVVGSTAERCALRPGVQTCPGGDLPSTRGILTQLCQHNSDCPAGTLCVSAAGVGDVPPTIHPQIGACAKACNQPGSGQCGRCDLVCNTSMGVCETPVVPSDAGFAPPLDAHANASP